MRRENIDELPTPKIPPFRVDKTSGGIRVHSTRIVRELRVVSALATTARAAFWVSRVCWVMPRSEPTRIALASRAIIARGEPAISTLMPSISYASEEREGGTSPGRQRSAPVATLGDRFRPARRPIGVASPEHCEVTSRATLAVGAFADRPAIPRGRHCEFLLCRRSLLPPADSPPSLRRNRVAASSRPRRCRNQFASRSADLRCRRGRHIRAVDLRGICRHIPGVAGKRGSTRTTSRPANGFTSEVVVAEIDAMNCSASVSSEGGTIR